MVHVHQIKVGPSWMDYIVLFLKEDILPEDKSKADKVRRKAPRFWLSENQKLYKRSFSSPYLLCIHPKAVELILKELHEGILWKPYWGKIFITQDPYIRLQVAEDAERCTGLCKEV